MIVNYILALPKLQSRFVSHTSHLTRHKFILVFPWRALTQKDEPLKPDSSEVIRWNVVSENSIQLVPQDYIVPVQIMEIRRIKKAARLGASERLGGNLHMLGGGRSEIIFRSMWQHNRYFAFERDSFSFNIIRDASFLHIPSIVEFSVRSHRALIKSEDKFLYRWRKNGEFLLWRFSFIFILTPPVIHWGARCAGTLAGTHPVCKVLPCNHPELVNKWVKPECAQ